MQDKSSYSNSNKPEISEGLQEYINSLVEEIVVNGETFEKNKKWLKKYLEAESINSEIYEKDFEDLLQLINDYRQTQSSAILRMMNSLSGNCYISEELLLTLISRGENVKVEEKKEYLYRKSQFDRGYIYDYCVTDKDKGECILENPYILIHDGSIVTFNSLQIRSVIQTVASKNKSLLIISSYSSDIRHEDEEMLKINFQRGILYTALVQAPGFGDRRIEIMKDLAILTGATVVSEGKGMKLENISLDMLGRAEKVIVNKENTTILDGAGEISQIQSRIAQIKTQLESCTLDYDKEKMVERLLKLFNVDIENGKSISNSQPQVIYTSSDKQATIQEEKPSKISSTTDSYQKRYNKEIQNIKTNGKQACKCLHCGFPVESEDFTTLGGLYVCGLIILFPVVLALLIPITPIINIIIGAAIGFIIAVFSGNSFKYVKKQCKNCCKEYSVTNEKIK